MKSRLVLRTRHLWHNHHVSRVHSRNTSDHHCLDPSDSRQLSLPMSASILGQKCPDKLCLFRTRKLLVCAIHHSDDCVHVNCFGNDSLDQRFVSNAIRFVDAVGSVLSNPIHWSGFCTFPRKLIRCVSHRLCRCICVRRELCCSRQLQPDQRDISWSPRWNLLPDLGLCVLSSSNDCRRGDVHFVFRHYFRVLEPISLQLHRELVAVHIHACLAKHDLHLLNSLDDLVHLPMHEFHELVTWLTNFCHTYMSTLQSLTFHHPSNHWKLPLSFASQCTCLGLATFRCDNHTGLCS